MTVGITNVSDIAVPPPVMTVLKDETVRAVPGAARAFAVVSRANDWTTRMTMSTAWLVKDDGLVEIESTGVHCLRRRGGTHVIAAWWSANAGRPKKWDHARVDRDHGDRRTWFVDGAADAKALLLTGAVHPHDDVTMRGAMLLVRDILGASLVEVSTDQDGAIVRTVTMPHSRETYEAHTRDYHDNVDVRHNEPHDISGVVSHRHVMSMADLIP